MKSYKFGNLDGVGIDLICNVFNKMLSDEMVRVRYFNYNNYEWCVGVDVARRINDINRRHPLHIESGPNSILGIQVIKSYAIEPNEILLHVRPDLSGIDELEKKVYSYYGLPSEYMNIFNLDVASLYPTEFILPRQSGKRMTSLKKMEETMNKIKFNRIYDASIKDVIFNNPATIILWKDGTKTVVKCGEGEVYDPEKGMAMAIAKRLLGNQGNYYDTFKKYLGKYEKKKANEDKSNKSISVSIKEKTDISLKQYCIVKNITKNKAYGMIKRGELDAYKDNTGKWRILI